MDRTVKEDVAPLNSVQQEIEWEDMTPYQQEMMRSVRRPSVAIPQEVRDKGQVAEWIVNRLRNA